jgi:sugar lactone lactonase YvrE
MRSGAMEVEHRVPSELWRVDAEGRGTEVCGGIAFPNGVGFAPDGCTLYLSNYSGAEVLAIDGDTGARRQLVRVPRGNPDGLAVDEAGGVWVALGDAGCVGRFTRAGALDRTLDVP